MKKILITGATGFAGTHLTNLLHQNPENKLFGTSFTSVTNTDTSITLEKVDLLDQDVTEAMLGKIKPDEVYHLAALSAPSLSFENPINTVTNNINAEIILLEGLRKLNLLSTKVLIISSAEIYGKVSPKNIPMNEDTPFFPVSPYAVSKIAQDFLALQYQLAYNMHIVRVRPFNHIGPGQSPSFAVAAFAKQIAEIEKGEKKPVLHVGKLNAKRDFTDVRDMVKAYVLALKMGTAGEVYNIGSDKSITIEHLLEMIINNSKVKVSVETDQSKFKPIDTPELLCNSQKFRNLTGWKPEITLEQTIQDILSYWRHQVSIES